MIFAATQEEISAWKKRSRADHNRIQIMDSNMTSDLFLIATRFLLELNRTTNETDFIVGTIAACDPQLNIGDVVITSDTMKHDFDVVITTHGAGRFSARKTRECTRCWQSDKTVREQAVRACEELGLVHHVGRVITGERPVTNLVEVARLRKNFNAVAIDTRTARLAELCQMYNERPWIGIFIVSDLADKSASVDFNKFSPKASERLADILERML